MAFSRNWVIAALGLSALVIGCDRNEQRALGTERDRDMRTAPSPILDPNRDMDPSRQTPAAEGASARPAERIAEARCERELRCGNIGTDKEFATRDACMSKIRADRKEELNLYECPGGFDEQELHECLTEIRNNDCNSPLDSLGRIIACRSSDICKNF